MCSEVAHHRAPTAVVILGCNEPRSPVPAGKIGAPTSEYDRVGTLIPFLSNRAYEMPAYPGINFAISSMI
jgi:hypothetical protein